MGGVQLISNAAIRDFFASRLEVPEDSMAPWIWAAAAGGAIQAAHIHWHLNGGNLAEIIADGLGILEEGIAASVPAQGSRLAGGNGPGKKRPPARPIATTTTTRDLRGAP
jgi:hypothetical protein